MFIEPCCFHCKHYRELLKNFRSSCDAFPDGDGIPDGHFCHYIPVMYITSGKEKPPAECANGVKFELDDDYEDPWERAERLRKEGYDVPE